MAEQALKEALYVIPRAWGSWFVGSFLICAVYGDPTTVAQSLCFTFLSLLVVGIEWGEVAAQRLEKEDAA